MRLLCRVDGVARALRVSRRWPCSAASRPDAVDDFYALGSLGFVAKAIRGFSKAVIHAQLGALVPAACSSTVLLWLLKKMRLAYRNTLAVISAFNIKATKSPHTES